jgi:hypothetical protein
VCAQGCARVSGLPGRGAVSEERPAAVRETSGLPFSDCQPSRVVGPHAWPTPLCHEIDGGAVVGGIGGGMYLWWELRGMRGVTLYMSPSSREEGNAEKGRNYKRHRDTEDKRARKKREVGEQAMPKIPPWGRMLCRVCLADRLTSSDCPRSTGYHPAGSRWW